MKKIILILLITLLTVSCSKEDSSCDDTKAAINANFDKQLEFVLSEPVPDQRKIDGIYRLRNEELTNACK